MLALTAETAPGTVPAPGPGATVPAAATTGIPAAANASLGSSTSAITCGLVNSGCFQNYASGSIMWSPATGAYITLGAIRQAWAGQGYETGTLGYPTSNEICGLRNGGCFQNYQGGSIMFSPATGAHVTLGAIRQAWAAQGYESGSLGYPTSNEVCGLRNGGCFQNYQGGSIMFSPATGAHISQGAIRQAWAAQGYENGRLGYPTTNEFPIGGGSVAQNYQGGQISWSPLTGNRIS
jgi:uncharacterized protein with LGFP repeats